MDANGPVMSFGKRKSSVLKIKLVDATEKETRNLAESIDWIHSTNMEMEESMPKLTNCCYTLSWSISR